MRDLKENEWKEVGCEIDCSDRDKVVIAGVEYPRIQASFPNWRQVVPSDEYPEAPVSVHYNPYLLAALSEAMGIGRLDGVTILSQDPHSPLFVESPQAVEGVVAILMPMRK